MQQKRLKQVFKLHLERSICTIPEVAGDLTVPSNVRVPFELSRSPSLSLSLSLARVLLSIVKCRDNLNARSEFTLPHRD